MSFHEVPLYPFIRFLHRMRMNGYKPRNRLDRADRVANPGGPGRLGAA
jgi:hypothetical protein